MSPQSNPSRNTRQSKSSGEVRIIGGQWRGRKLTVANVQGLRPTGDRVRETLFNWLQPYVSGAQCLDLYAGSGALGFEALSRHAASLLLVEPASSAVVQLHVSAKLLQNDVVTIEKKTAERFLSGNEKRFDIVFIDPPFDQSVQWKTLKSLIPAHLSPNAWVYIESPRTQDVPDSWPEGIDLHREKRFGDVCARLFHFKGDLVLNEPT